MLAFLGPGLITGASDERKVMGRFILPRLLWAMGWLSTAAVAVAVAAVFLT